MIIRLYVYVYQMILYNFVDIVSLGYDSSKYLV